MYEKFENQKVDYFFGVCHAGLGEYVVPIRHNNILLGSINAGFFQLNEPVTEWCIKKACKESNTLCPQTACSLYKQHISSPTISIEELLPVLQLLAEYLGHTYDIIHKTHPEATTVFRYRTSNEDEILSHAISYIQQNSNQQITIDNLATACYCSNSYLSHIFKKRTGVNINIYINKIRIELSKNHLINSKISIAEIAITVGFNDPNYFSRVFTQIIGISPTEYRRRFKNY
jgi:YesN/AraC family two-component response regulator